VLTSLKAAAAKRGGLVGEHAALRVAAEVHVAIGELARRGDRRVHPVPIQGRDGEVAALSRRFGVSFMIV
jgi:hypothetical protein